MTEMLTVDKIALVFTAIFGLIGAYLMVYRTENKVLRRTGLWLFVPSVIILMSTWSYKCSA